MGRRVAAAAWLACASVAAAATVAAAAPASAADPVLATTATAAVSPPALGQMPPTTTTLKDGQQVTATAGFFQYTYFTISYAVPITSIVITAEQLAGAVGVYVTLDGSIPTYAAFQYSAVSSQAVTKTITISGSDASVQRYCPAGSLQPCDVNIAVRGQVLSSSNNFTLVSARPSSAVTLLPGVPLAGQFAPAGTYLYYTLEPANKSSPVTISVTPASGDPDVFITSTWPPAKAPVMSDPSSYCAYSMTARREVVEIFPGVSPCWCGNVTGRCVYTVGVLAYPPSNATFSVLGQTDTPAITTLLDGAPQLGYTLAGSSQQFTFAAQLNASAGINAVEVTLSPFMGDADLFVALNGLPASSSNFAYSSTKGPGQTDAVVVRPADKQFQQYCGAGSAAGAACTLSVGVFAYSATLWSLVATNAFYLTLGDGVSQRASVDQGAWAYFRYTYTDADRALVFSVDQVSGDSDVYVGCGAGGNTTQPTSAAGSYLWSSTGVGTEVVYVAPTDPLACAATADYFIGVTSYTRNATFAVTARSRSTRPALLALGQPVEDQVAATEYAYYSFVWDWSRAVAWVEVDASLGDSGLYVLLNSTSDASSLPSTTFFAYSSQSVTGLEQLTIRQSDPQFLASPCAAGAPGGGGSGGGVPTNCTVTIAVYGLSTSRFTLTAWTSLRQLDDGVPVVATVSAGDADYFAFVVSDRSTPVSFFVTPLDAGDPDLYVAVGAQFPNASSYNWTSNSPGSEVLQINPATDPQLAAYAPSAYPLTLYAAVEAWGRAPATFSIVATSNPTVTLADGVPVGGAGVAYSLSYYSFYVPAVVPGQPAGRSFEVVAVPLSGGPVDLYVNNEPSRPFPVCSSSCATGVMTNYHWSSDGGPLRSRVLVSSGDASYVPGRTYVVAVYAEAAASYVLTASFTDSIRTLQAGVPAEDTVAPGAALFYRLLLRQPGADVAVVVTPVSGDPDLYVSVHAATPRPGPAAGFDKRSTGAAGSSDAVYFQWQELAECQVAIAAGGDCDVWVGVWGFAGANINSTFTVTASVEYGQSNATMLVDGVPQSGNVTAGRYAYYWASVRVPDGTTYSVAVQPTSGDADLYVRTDALTVPGWPSSSNFQYSSSNSLGDDYVNVMPGTPGYNATALLRVAVLGYSAAASYVVTFATAAAVAQLADGVALVGTLPRGGSAYFSFANPTPGVDLAFALTALSGDPDLYVSPWPAGSPRFRPGPGGSAACRSGTRYGGDTVEVYSSGGDACYCVGCTYIVGVYCAIAAGGSCRFTVTGSSVSPYSLIALAEGRPASNAVRQGGYKYFSYDARFFNGTQRSVTLRLVGTGGAGAVRAFVTNAYVPGVSPVSSLPTNTSGAQWASPVAGPQAGVVSIAWNDPAVASCAANAANPAGGVNCTFYTIAVQGLASGTSLPFTLTGSSTDAPQLLVPGLPSAPAEVARGGAQHFAVDVSDTSSDLVVAVTVLSGHVALSLDPRNAATGCSGMLPSVACDGTWANPNNGFRPAGSATLIRVSASAPCAAGPPVNPSPPPYNCSYARGRYFIGVYGVFASTFTVTALQAASLVQLEDGTPFSDAAASIAPVTAVYRPSYASSGPSVKLTLDASGADAALALYVTSCVEGSLGPSACTDAARAPGPTSYDALLIVDSGTSQDLIVTKHSPAFCAPVSPALTCSYFVGVAPAGPADCNPPGCDGSFTLVAQQDAPGTRSQVAAASINGRVAENIGVVAQAPGSVNYYEIFLDSGGNAAGVTLNVTLDACGPAFTSLYFCDPSRANGCTDTFSPSRASHTGVALFTAAATGSGTPGRAVGSLTVGVTAGALYAAVVADSALSSSYLPAAGGGGGAGAGAGAGGSGGGAGARLGQAVPAIGGQYVLTLSAGPNVTYLYPPANASVSVVVTGAGGGTTLNVSWSPPLIGDVGTPGVGVPAGGVTYLVYAAPVSFFDAAAAAAGGGVPPPVVVPTTACGLDFWGRVTGVQPVVVVGATWAELADLAPNTAYQVNVAATCSNACWAANRLRAGPHAPAAAATTTSFTLGGGAGGGLGAPGYNTQRLAYAGGGAVTGAGGAPVSQGTPTGVIAGAVSVTLLAVAVAGFAYFRYVRSKRPDFSQQYDSLDVSAAMSTISTPAATMLRSAGSALLSSLSSLRGLLAVPSGGGGGYARSATSAPLAEQDDGGGASDDARVSGFM